MLLNLRRRLHRRHSRQGLWLIPLLIGTAGLLWLTLNTDEFNNPQNLFNLVSQAMPLIIVSIGQMIVVLIGGMDLSVGSVMSITTTILALDAPSYLLIPLVFVGAASVGLINGIAVTYMNVHPIIATLAMQYIVLGIARILRPVAGGDVPEIIVDAVTATPFGLPVPIIWGLLIVLISWKMIHSSRFGLHLFAIGGSVSEGRQEIAHNFGIPVKRNILLAYILCSTFAAVAGIFVAGRIVSGDPGVGSQFGLDSLTAVAIGGTLLTGGVGSLHGTLIGSVLMAVLANGMNIANLSTFIQVPIKGSILLLVVACQPRNKIGL